MHELHPPQQEQRRHDNETAITAEQAAVLEAGGPMTYTVRDERLLVDEDGQIIHYDSAISPKPDA